jgi:hypothetical protein
MVNDKKVNEVLGNNIESLYEYIFTREQLSGNLNSYKETLLSILNLWITYTACILDMYFLGRMFKSPKNNINSYLTLGFFGFNHTRAISSYLTEYKMWYDVKYSSNESDRCIRMNKEVDANFDIEAYLKWRSSQDMIGY